MRGGLSGGVALWQLVKADFLDRVRRHSFLITLGVTAFIGFVAVPGPDANYSVFALGDYRLVYNSAGVGLSVAVFTTLTLALAGFYLVSDALARDRRTGVGQIIAATPVARWQAGQLLAPFLYATVPALAVVAAIAVVFESIKALRGGFGNVLYFFLWGAGLMLPIASLSGERAPLVDVTGIGYVLHTVLEAFHAAMPAETARAASGVSRLSSRACGRSAWRYVSSG